MLTVMKRKYQDNFFVNFISRTCDNKIVPGYAIVPLAMMLAANCIAYFGTRLVNTGMTHYDMSTKLDEMIPMLTPFVSVYILAYVQWIVGYILIVRESKDMCKWVATGELIAKFMTMVCFLVIPTTIARPDILGNSMWSELSRMIYSADAADNLFPSVHCLESWMCFRGSLYLKKTPSWVKYPMFVFTILVFASTVFMKQHVVLDMVGAIVVVETGLYISKVIWKKIDNKQ